MLTRIRPFVETQRDPLDANLLPEEKGGAYQETKQNLAHQIYGRFGAIGRIRFLVIRDQWEKKSAAWHHEQIVNLRPESQQRTKHTWILCISLLSCAC